MSDTEEDTLDVDAIERRANREAMQDGLGEILVGIILIGMGAASVHLFLAAIYLIPLILSRKISEVFKRRFTYPRIGYVKPHEEGARKVLPGVFLYEIAVFAGLAVAFLLIFGDLADPQVWSRWSPLLFAMMLVGAYLYSHGRSGNRLYLAYAGFALASGIAFSLASFEGMSFPYLFGDWGPGIVIFFLVTGSGFLLFGLSSLLWFITRHPVEAAGDDCEIGA
jgi:hypothetical protein